MAMIDDPLNEEARMNTKPAKKGYNTIGVRFIYGHNLDKVYTYRVKKGAKLHLGQEVVVPSMLPILGRTEKRPTKSVAVVVEIHKKRQDTGPYNYLYIDGTIKTL